MDNFGKLAKGQEAALVIVAFLQADCIDPVYTHEILSLCNDITAEWDINRNEQKIDSVGDFDELESDGNLSESIKASLDDIQPLVELPWLAGDHPEDGVDYHGVAQALREIAAQFEHSLLAQATQNLGTKISSSPSEQWKYFLKEEVERLMRRGTALEHLHQERVIVALTLTLVKGVCIQAPQLIRSLFTTVHQFVCRTGAR
ncbi:uncharacterized protein LOC108237478 isoform X2 [Kryptolebias marmoratus]|nr:uncharacterized protein LOC108237478 isoform X2 [Kryptolebias marmoratus]